MKLVVTGAGGFVGGFIARAAGRAGFDVTALYRNTLKSELSGEAGINLVRGDLADGVQLPSRFDALVHCAAEIPGLCPDPDRLFRHNVEGARRLLDQALAAGARRIVNFSSMSVYGTIAAPVVTEETPCDRPDVYGQSKREVETLLQDLTAATDGLAALSIRLPGTVGKGSHHNFLSDTLAKILAGEALRANNPDAPFNNIVYVGDLADFVLAWVSQASQGYAVTNLAAEEPMRIRDVLSLLFELTGRPEGVTYLPGAKVPFQISLDRARALGYRPSTVRASLGAFVRDVLDQTN